jgi:glycosyltransferase involved in cell wall biosynthesis
MYNQNIVILYAEVMPYNVVAFEALVRQYSNYNLHVFCWNTSKKLTNYQQPNHQKINYYEEAHYTAKELLNKVKDLEPKLLLVSGRMEQKYLFVAQYFKKRKIPVVGNSDNQIKNNLKTKITFLFSYWLYKKYFSHMLVPGELQKQFCLKLGFKENQIYFPQYTADVTLFSKNDYTNSKKNKIVFIGRLEKIKGIDLLTKAFVNLYDQQKITQKLVIIGDGSLRDSLPIQHKGIGYYPFSSQENVLELIKDARYFCLPSLDEPWGLVIHEAVAAGLPLVTTDVCGASHTFLTPNKNGYFFERNNVDLLQSVLLKMHHCSDDELLKMSTISKQNAKKIAPEMWGKALIEIINT